MDPLFPELPEDLTVLSDEELSDLLQQHNTAADLIDEGGDKAAEFTKGLEAADLLAQYQQGVEQIEAIEAEQKARVEASEKFLSEMQALSSRRKGEPEEAEVEEPEVVAEVEETEELAAEDDKSEEDEEKDEQEEEPEEAVVAAAKPVRTASPAVRMRRPPAPSPDRMPNGQAGAVLTAAAGVEGVPTGGVITDRKKLATAMQSTANRWGRVAKHEGGVEQRILIANATYPFPEDRKLHASDWAANQEKIASVVPASIPGQAGMSLVASGGFCAPLEPIYTMPNFASQARPVRDALPSFQADRGGVNVPAATYIADITEAITVIDADEDALGGTFATKSCQDLDCPAYTETAVTVISHCREYGNLNAIAWPEKIAHENDLTMAAHARTAEGYLLDRIKAQSVNVTNGAETLSALIYLVDAIVKAKFGIQGRLRMDPSARFRALIPWWVPEMLALDTVQTNDGNRFATVGQLNGYLSDRGINVSYYLDSPSTGTTQLPDASQTAAAIDALPDNVQWALFPEGAFIHLDMGSLELGIVRDSTLNSTNDYQIFGETFENVARIAPAQAAYWVTSDLCANGMLAPAGTARTCD